MSSMVSAGLPQAGLILSTQVSVSLEKVAQEVQSEGQQGPLWFQLCF
jgi:hypothetical protein